MPKASFSHHALLTTLPEKAAAAGCCALTKGLGEHAAAFSLDALTGEDALLGADLPLSVQQGEGAASAFFDVPAPVYLCDEVTSTFAVAHALAQEDRLPAWGAVIAACQTEGRGQFRRHWQSPRGNLYVTFRLPESPLFKGSQAALATGALLAMAFCNLGYPLRLKWPNDLLNRNQEKAAGILLEERGGVMMAGVGVNLCKLPDAGQLRLDRAAAAGLLVDTHGNPSALSPFAQWQALVGEMISVFQQAFTGVKPEALPGLINPFLAWRGEVVSVSDVNGSTQSGWLGGVTPAGGLFLMTSDGGSQELFRGSLARV